jgi:hypothetical protein
MKKAEFQFGNLDTHSAIIVQRALEGRKIDITAEDRFKKMSDKEITGHIDELDTMINDLDRHIASNVRMEERKHDADEAERKLTGMGKQ